MTEDKLKDEVRESEKILPSVMTNGKTIEAPMTAETMTAQETPLSNQNIYHILQMQAPFEPADQDGRTPSPEPGSL